DAGGNFSTTVGFGNDSTPDGLAFRIEVVLVQSQAQADQLFTNGMTYAVPTNLAHSAVGVVFRSNPPDPAPDGSPAPVTIDSPLPGDVLPQYVSLYGHMADPQNGWPVVLVKADIDGEPWYVMPAVLTVNADGSFFTSIYIGNWATEALTGFKIEVVLAPSQDQAYQLFPEGMAMQS